MCSLFNSGGSYIPKVDTVFFGTGHAVAIRGQGRGYGWGYGTKGQLGNSILLDRDTPTSIFGNKTFCKVSAGLDFSLGLDKNGKVWSWGVALNGKLGDNTLVDKLTPVSLGGATKTFCDIAAGENHGLAIDKNGKVWGWGLNGDGQLGDNTTVSKNTPVAILGQNKTFCKVSGGARHSIGIDKNGKVWGWGYNGDGELGNNATKGETTPVSVLGANKTFCQISSARYHCFGIDKNGILWAWGYNTCGRLGDNSLTIKLTPVTVAGAAKTFCRISGGLTHSMGIDKNGQVWGWGNNIDGRINDSVALSHLTPVSITGAKKTFCHVGVGIKASVAIDKYGRAWAWGNGFRGALGNNEQDFYYEPETFTGQTKTFCEISSRNSHGLGIDKNGVAWSWGLNDNGQLGINSITNQSSPVNLLGTTKTFCKVAAGDLHSLAIDKNGRAWSWGLNTSGQLGDNTLVSKRTPVNVGGATKTFCKIAGGGQYITGGHSLAIDKNGRAWGWGNNSNGQVGDNTIANKQTPVNILGAIKTFCNISAGEFHSVAVDKNGIGWGWGSNASGQVGDNSITDRRTPVSILGAVKTFCQISAGKTHSVGLDKNGKVWCWGINDFGQLGDNTIISKRTPIAIFGAAKTFCQVSAGYTHTVALDKNGLVWGWGYNKLCNLGDGTDTNRLTPVSVAGARKTFCYINSANDNVFVIDNYGKAWGWGYNLNGRLARPAVIRKTPVRLYSI